MGGFLVFGKSAKFAAHWGHRAKLTCGQLNACGAKLGFDQLLSGFTKPTNKFQFIGEIEM